MYTMHEYRIQQLLWSDQKEGPVYKKMSPKIVIPRDWTGNPEEKE